MRLLEPGGEFGTNNWGGKNMIIDVQITDDFPTLAKLVVNILDPNDPSTSTINVSLRDRNDAELANKSYVVQGSSQLMVRSEIAVRDWILNQLGLALA